jgi:hypothetical protein
VAPLAQDLPLAIFERFEPPSDRLGGTVNLITDPNGATVGDWTVTGTGSAVPVVAAGTSPMLGGGGTHITRSPLAGTNGTFTIAAATSDATARVVPGRYYALRWRFAGNTDWVGAPTIDVTVRWLTQAGATISTIAVGSVSSPKPSTSNETRDVTAVLQAPAGADTAQLRADVAYTAATISIDGYFGQALIAEVLAASSPVPAYGDGDTGLYRWTGAPGASPSAELEEAKLADYKAVTLATNLVTPATASGVERVTRAGLYQMFDSATTLARDTGAKAHTARLPVREGEVMVSGRYEVASSGGNSYTNFLAPGVGYSDQDGRYVYATVEAGNFRLYYFDGTAHNLLTTAATSGLPAAAGDGKIYWLAIRLEGSSVTAEWYGSTIPAFNRTNYITRLRGLLTTGLEDIFGARGRPGYPMPRARGMFEDGAALITSFDYRPFLTTENRLPVTVALRGVPGTAPALLSPAFGLPGSTSSAQAFALLAWARRAGRENYASTGDGRSIGNGWAEINSATLESFVADGPTAAGGPADLTRSNRISAHATNTGSGATFRVYRLLRRGVAYTAEIWVKAEGAATWALDREEVDAASGSSIFTAVPGAGALAAAGGWQRFRVTFTPSLDRRSLAWRFVASAAGATNKVYATGFGLWEGRAADAPLTREQTSGRGGAGVLSVIEAENNLTRIPAGTSGVGDGGIDATDPGELHNGLKLYWNTVDAGTGLDVVPGGLNGSMYLVAEYLVDPLLFAAPDFAGDTIDVVVYASGTIDEGIARPMLRASAVHEHDPNGYARSYTREFGKTGRYLFPYTTAVSIPSGVDPQRAGFTTRLGTLTLPRRSGRVILQLSPGWGSGAPAGTKFGLDQIVIAPAWAVASSPTGKSYGGTIAYPTFAPKVFDWGPGGNTRSTERRVSPDGAVLTIVDTGGEYPYGTIGGEPMEVEPGDVDLLAWSYADVPDNPEFTPSRGLYDANGVGPYPPGTGASVWADVTPRYRLLPA